MRIRNIYAIILGLLAICHVLQAQPNITSIEYYFDSDPGFGNGIPISFTESNNVNINSTLDVSGISDGFHWIYIRGRDADGRWSVSSYRIFYKGAISIPTPTSVNITKVEYFFDADPGFGKGIQIPVTPGTNVNVNQIIDVSSIPDGFHWIYLRGMDENDRWSVYSYRMFYKGVISTPTPSFVNITKVEYFFDIDPGFSNGTPVNITSGTNVNINQVFDVSSLSDGFHWINIRGMDANGRWSVASHRFFYKGDLSTASPALANIVQVEYFFDTDPGFGNGNQVSITPGATVSINQDINIGALSDGFHRFYIRGKDANGRWSVMSWRIIWKGQYDSAPSASTIKRVEYFIDTDPGFGLATPLSFTQDAEVSINSVIDLGALSEGSHDFSVRVKDSFGRWSYLTTRSFVLDMTPPDAPGDASIIIGNSQVTLKWRKNNETDFLKYRIYRGTSSGVLTLADSTSAGNSDTTKIVTGLTNDINYFFHITAVDSAMLESTQSNEVNGVPLASAGPPPAPIVNSASDLNQYSFKANWNSSPSATGYYLDVSTNVNFTSFVAGYNNKDVGDVLNFNVTGLSLNSTYYYRLRASSSYGTSLNSGTISVTTLLNAPAQPSSPDGIAANLITQTGFTANWNSSVAATGYFIDVASDMSFSGMIAGFDNKDIGNVLNTPVSGLIKNTPYYYRIRAYNSYGTSSSSNTISLTTLPDPPSPPVAVAASNIAETFFTANWGTSATATGYRLDVATDNTFTAFLPGFDNKDVSNTSSFIITGLTANVTYYYRIRAYNTGGTSSNSNSIAITTAVGLPPAPDPPAILDASNISQTSFTARWNASSTALGYKIDVSTDIGFINIVSGYNNKDIGDVISTSITGLIANTTYYYRVRAYNTGGISNNSNVMSVATPPYLPVAPSGLIAASCDYLVTLKWRINDEPDFLRYRIYGGTTPNPTTKIDSTSGDRLDTMRVYTGLDKGQTYYYRVTSVNTIGLESVYSNPASIIVKKGVIPKIHVKWNDVLICYNLGDSLSTYQWVKGTSAIPGATGQYYLTNKQPGEYSVITMDKNGCRNTSNAISISGAKSLVVYPNPAVTRFVVNLKSESVGRSVIRITSSSGLLVYENQVEKTDYELLEEIHVNNLANGTYTIEVIVNNKEISYSKIVIIK